MHQRARRDKLCSSALLLGSMSVACVIPALRSVRLTLFVR